MLKSKHKNLKNITEINIFFETINMKGLSRLVFC